MDSKQEYNEKDIHYIASLNKENYILYIFFIKSFIGTAAYADLRYIKIGNIKIPWYLEGI
jgi:hypothetical protein